MMIPKEFDLNTLHGATLKMTVAVDETEELKTIILAGYDSKADMTYVLLSKTEWKT